MFLMKLRTLITINVFWLIGIVYTNYFFLQPETVDGDCNPPRVELFKDFFTQYEAVKAVNIPPEYFYAKKINVFNPYFPPVAMLYRPFTIFPYKTAAFIFFLINISAYLYTVEILRRNFLKDNIILYSAALLFPPALNTIFIGNNNIIILLALTLLCFNKKNSRMLNAFLLTAAIIIKIYSFILLLYYLSKKKYKDFIYVLICITIFAAVSILVINPENYSIYFKQISPNYKNAWIVKNLGNHSFLSLSHKLFGNTIDETIPIVYYPGIIFPLTYLISFIFLASTFILTLKNNNNSDNLNLYIVTMLLTFGVTWNHTFALLIMPLIYCYYLLTNNSYSGRLKLLFYISFLLIALDFNKDNLKTGYQLLLTCPKLYGTIILYFIYARIFTLANKKNTI